MPSCLRLAVATLLLIVSIRAAFAQGSLTPPGAPAPTMKTLAQIEPRIPVGTNTTPGDAGAMFNITQPGTYYLTTNLTGVTNKHGISISTPSVTLDLMGFELAGVPNSLAGIYIAPGSTNVVVRNGTLRNWGNVGVNGSSSYHCEYVDLRLSGNGFRGLSCGPMGVVTRCVAQYTAFFQLNGGSGIFAEFGTAISGCTVSYNASRGIEAGDGSVVSDCGSVNNNTDGIYVGEGVVKGCTAFGNKGRGVWAGVSGTIVDCAAYQNTLDGIWGGDNCVVSRCTASGNHRFGIYAFDSGTVDRCTAYNNLFGGIYAGDSSAISGCSAYLNTSNGVSTANGSLISGCVASQNTSNGIAAGVSGSIKDCTAFQNSGNGILVSNGCSIISCNVRSNVNDGIAGAFACTIRDCNASDNLKDGIQVVSGSYLTQNNCYNNGVGTNDGAGIHVTGNNNRIDGNHVSFADRGLDVSGIDNLIVRNSVSFTTTNYVIGSNNRVGFIVAPPSSGTISGSTGGAGVGTTDPWANLSF